MTETKDVKTAKKFNLDAVVDVTSKIGGWLGRQKHFAAIRDGFATAIPFLIVGAMALLIREVFISNTGLIGTAVGAPETGTAWAAFSEYVSPVFTAMAGATLDLLALYMAYLVGYHLTRSQDGTAVLGGMVGIVSYMLLMPFNAGQALAADNSGWFGSYLNPRGMLMSLVISLLSVSLYNRFGRIEKLTIKMPAGVPPAIAKSFNQLIPIALTMLIFATIQPIWGAIAKNAIPAGETLNLTYGQILNGDVAGWNTLSAQQIQDLIAAAAVEGHTITVTFDANGFVDSVTGVAGAEGFIGDYISTEFGITEFTSNWVNGSEYFYLLNAIDKVIAQPFKTGASTLPVVMVIAMLSGLLFFFGLHGAAILAPIIEVFWLGNSTENVSLFGEFGYEMLDPDVLIEAADIPILESIGFSGFQVGDKLADVAHRWTKVAYDSFVMLGGGGATLGLLVSVKAFGRRHKTANAITNVSFAPGLFNINEPVVFGLPIMLNFVFFLPFVFTPMFLALNSFMWLQNGWVNPTIALIPWTSPLFVSGLLGTGFDVMSVLLTFINFIITLITYGPALLLDMKTQKKMNPESIADDGPHGVFDALWNKIRKKDDTKVVEEESKEDLTVDFESKSLTQLKSIASIKNIDLPDDASKEEIVAILEKEYNDKKRNNDSTIVEEEPKEVSEEITEQTEEIEKEVSEEMIEQTEEIKEEVSEEMTEQTEEIEKEDLTIDFSKKTVVQLRAFAKEENIVIPSTSTKKDMIEILEKEYNEKKRN